MPRPHRHDDLEINIVLQGRLDYLFAGTGLSVGPGEIAVFWAAMPHRLIDPQEGETCWVHLPLSTVLSWSLASEDVRTLLQMMPVIVPLEAVPGDVAAQFEAWRHELMGEHPEIAMLEAQALVRRVLSHRRRNGVPEDDVRAGAEPGSRQLGWAEAERSRSSGHVAGMAQHIATHFRESITVPDIAASVHLSPAYAMGVFREALGVTLGEYLLRCRIAEAQRLLITTDSTAGEIAVQAGFASQSSFYAHFKRACGVSPAAYRKQLG